MVYGYYCGNYVGLNYLLGPLINNDVVLYFGVER